MPTEQVVEVRDGKKKTTTRKIYPGYMFVQMDMDNESFHVVRTTPKVLYRRFSEPPAHARG